MQKRDETATQIRAIIDDVADRAPVDDRTPIIDAGVHPPDPLALVLIGQKVAEAFAVPPPGGEDPMGLDERFPINPTIADYVDWVHAHI